MKKKLAKPEIGQASEKFRLEGDRSYKRISSFMILIKFVQCWKSIILIKNEENRVLQRRETKRTSFLPETYQLQEWFILS